MGSCNGLLLYWDLYLPLEHCTAMHECMCSAAQCACCIPRRVGMNGERASLPLRVCHILHCLVVFGVHV